MGQFTHDLRNGLNALELQLTLLGEMNQDAALAEDIVAMRTTLSSLSREMQAVRSASAAASPSLITYPAGDLLEDLRERQEKQAAGAFQWQFAPETTGLNLELDPEMLLAALLHLLSNALRFREGKEASLRFEAREAAPAEADASALTIFLSEAKAAPPSPDALAAWGAEPLLTTRRGGYGLGLFRARRVVEAHSGTLRAHWEPAPQNALITTVWLPAKRTDAARNGGG